MDTNLPACPQCGTTQWYYGEQTTTFYEVTRLLPSPDGEDDERVAVVDRSTADVTDCAWRDVQCANGHDLESWDRTTDDEAE